MLPAIQGLADGLKPFSDLELNVGSSAFTGAEKAAIDRLNETGKKLDPLLKLYAIDAANAASVLRTCAKQYLP